MIRFKTATTVRVPVFVSHSESINIETNQFISADNVRQLLSQTPGVKVVDDPSQLKNTQRHVMQLGKMMCLLVEFDRMFRLPMV